MPSAIPSVGRGSNRDPNVGSIPTQYVSKLTSTTKGTYRNVTTDNWFSSCDLTKKMLDKNHSMIGKLRKIRIEVPAEFLIIKRRQIPVSAFTYSKNFRLVSLISEKTWCVISLSSMHFQDKNINIFFLRQLREGDWCARWTLPFENCCLKYQKLAIANFVWHVGQRRCKFLQIKFLWKSFFICIPQKMCCSLVEDLMKKRVTNDRLPRK